ncbi:hypothetical protein [Xanthomonas arboricola]|uniref:DUF4469 domain-containing protein n=1 Tax=Xanthomonas arboricola TaxID=56448 RepID=A0AAU9ILK4_9XANT|nr:hypothetical protein [Xanthomonas arboricola]CAE6837038.1 hypothetical protein XA1314C_37280 [Xanthomonas arboricola]CAE6837053.1 hypothetical protein XA1314C_37280 [Xanthomonas arboricola]
MATQLLPVQVRTHVDAPANIVVWARDDQGPIDLSEQELSVSVRMYGKTAELLSIPATGDSSGGVSFTVPNDLGKRYGRGLYRILVVSAANGATHEGTLEVL